MRECVCVCERESSLLCVCVMLSVCVCVMLSVCVCTHQHEKYTSQLQIGVKMSETKKRTHTVNKEKSRATVSPSSKQDKSKPTAGNCRAAHVSSYNPPPPHPTQHKWHKWKTPTLSNYALRRQETFETRTFISHRLTLLGLKLGVA